MDIEKAVEQLAAFIEQVDHADELFDVWYRTEDDAVGTQFAAIADELRAALPMIQAIAEQSVPALLDEFAEHPESLAHSWGRARRAAVQVRGKLASQDEIELVIGPAGPKLEASSLHPVIWQSAARLWDDGHHPQAVQTAGSALEGHIQGAVGRSDLSGTDLSKVFGLSGQPSGSDPRLRFPDIDPESKGYASAHEGMAALVRGAMMAIRNLASHPGGPNFSENEALEQLAALSYIARLTDRAKRVTGP